MADGAERIADLVRDTGGQAAKRGQLHLLGLVSDLRGVLEEDQYIPRVAAAQWIELGLEFRPLALRTEGRRFGGDVPAPLREPLVQFRRSRFEVTTDGGGRHPQQVPGGIVDHEDPAVRVEHQHTGAQMLDDIFVDHGHMAQFVGPGLGKFLAGARPAAQDQGQDGGGEKDDA